MLQQGYRVSHHLISDRPPVDAGANGSDRPCRRDAQRHRRPRPDVPRSEPDEVVPGPHPGGPHRDERLARAGWTRIGKRQLPHIAAEPLDSGRLHEAPGMSPRLPPRSTRRAHPAALLLSLSALVGADCSWELSRLLNSMRGRQAARKQLELAETSVPLGCERAGLKGCWRLRM